MTKRMQADREYTQQAMPQQADLAAAVLPYANKITSNTLELVQARDRMNMNNMMADANTEMAMATAKWQNENSNNPFDPNAGEALKQTYNEIFNKYGEKISVTSRGEWAQMQNKMQNQYLQSNLRWATGQSIKNAEASVNMSFEKGNEFAYNSAVGGVDVGLVNGNFEARAEMIRSSLSTIGKSDVQIEEILANHKSDYMKSYVTGAIFRDPEYGETLLKDKDVLKDIDSYEAVDSLREYAKKRKAQMSDEQSWIIDDTSSKAVQKFVLDPNTNFAEGMQFIESEYLAGNLGKGEAMRDALVNNLKSVKAVEAQTNKKIMTELLLQVSDAQAGASGGKDMETEAASEFLQKIAEVRQKALNYNSDGVLWKGDLEKIEDEIVKTVDAKKKLSDATQAIAKDGGWGSAFSYKDAYEQKQYFGGLPLSERDGALRDFFYGIKAQEAKGVRMNNVEKKKLAAQIRQNRSADFLNRVNTDLKNEVTGEKEKLKTFATAKEYNAAKSTLKIGQMVVVAGKKYTYKG